MGWMRVVASVALTGMVVGGGLSFAATRQAEPTGGAERAVLRVVQKGQRAVLENRPRLVCRLLTRRARRNSLRLFNLDQHPDGQPRPRPKTCRRAIRYQIADARDAGELRALRSGGAQHATHIVSIEDRRAHVRKGGDTDIYLIKTARGWRGDDSDFAPFNGSSGY